MSVVQVTRRITGRGLNTRVDQRGAAQSSAELVYDVITDSVDDDEAVVKLHPAVPKERISVHPASPYLRCLGVRCQQLQPTRWEVTASYDAPFAFGNDSDPNPLNEPAVLDWDTVDSDEPVDTDVNGDPICTIIGEPFDPPVTVPHSDLLLKIQKNSGTFDPAVMVSYVQRRAVNSDTVLGQPPGCVRCNKIRASLVNDAEFPYFRVYGEFQFRRGIPELNVPDSKAFYVRRRAEGLYVRLPVGLGGEIIHALRGGEPVTRPVLHYATGGSSYEAGEMVPDPEGAAGPSAEWYLFQVHPSLPFSALGFFS